MNILEQIIDGYYFRHEQLDFFDKLRAEILPSKLFENPSLRKEFESYLDKQGDNFFFQCGMELYGLIHQRRLREGQYESILDLIYLAYEKYNARLEIEILLKTNRS